jgi:hypothetical protein
MFGQHPSERATLERLQGRQMDPYGYGAGYGRANHSSWDTNTVLPYEAHPMPGNLGYRFPNGFAGVHPVAYMKGYGGDLPLSQQPKIAVPDPWTYRYKG